MSPFHVGDAALRHEEPNVTHGDAEMIRDLRNAHEPRQRGTPRTTIRASSTCRCGLLTHLHFFDRILTTSQGTLQSFGNRPLLIDPPTMPARPTETVVDIPVARGDLNQSRVVRRRLGWPRRRVTAAARDR
jgi:hypothetical protein